MSGDPADAPPSPAWIAEELAPHRAAAGLAAHAYDQSAPDALDRLASGLDVLPPFASWGHTDVT